MWKVDRTFFLRSEPGTGARLQKMWRENRTFFCGLNLEQVLAYRKCGEKITPFFLRSEPGTGAGRVDRKCRER